jgi:hypothetical protein
MEEMEILKLMLSGERLTLDQQALFLVSGIHFRLLLV